MAYNLYPQYYPSYQNPIMPQINQLSQNQFNQQTQNSSALIWVQGIEGAKSYLVAPNTTVQLWDSESQIIYLKSADSSGMPSIKILDYTIRENSNTNKPSFSGENYATKDEFEQFKKSVLEMIKGETEA